MVNSSVTYSDTYAAEQAAILYYLEDKAEGAVKEEMKEDEDADNKVEEVMSMTMKRWKWKKK